MLPPHIQQTLDDLAAMRSRLDATEEALRTLYGLGPVAETGLPLAETKPPRRNAKVSPRETKAAAHESKSPSRKAPKADPRIGSKYDDGILRALKTEAAAHGLTCGDITRTFTGPGKPAEVEKLNPLVWAALKSLIKRGQVRKDGRHYYIVRAHEREAGVQ